MYNALDSSDEVSRLFPEGHELYELARPTFNTIRRALAGSWISCIWNDAKEDPTRAGFRRSYDDVYGPGSVNVMPAIATWLSTGPGSGAEGNRIAQDQDAILPIGFRILDLPFRRPLSGMGDPEHE